MGDVEKSILPPLFYHNHMSIKTLQRDSYYLEFYLIIGLMYFLLASYNNIEIKQLSLIILYIVDFLNKSSS